MTEIAMIAGTTAMPTSHAKICCRKARATRQRCGRAPRGSRCADEPAGAAGAEMLHVAAGETAPALREHAAMTIARMALVAEQGDHLALLLERRDHAVE